MSRVSDLRNLAASCGSQIEVDLVVRAGTREREVTVSIPHDASVADLVAVLEPGAADDAVSIDGVGIEPGACIRSIGLRYGNVVEIGDPSTSSPSAHMAGPVVAIVGGPDAGQLVAFEGSIVIGSAPCADLRVSDATVSGRHLRIESAGPGSVRYVDLASHNGVRVEGKPIHDAAIVAWGELVTVGATELVVRFERDERPSATPPAQSATITLNRPPRERVELPVGEVAVPDPPIQRRGPAPFDVAALIGPIVMAAVMVVVLGSIRYAVFALMGPVLLIVSQLIQCVRLRGQRRTWSRSERAQLANLAFELARAVDQERARVERMAPDPAAVVRRALTGSTRLWERRPDHADHLVCRIGRGDRSWQPPVDADRVARHGGLDDLIRAASVVPRSPIEVDLRVDRVVGIVGDRAQSVSLARSLVLQAATLHGPADLSVEVHTVVDSREDWAWVGWLPHARADGSGRPAVFVSDEQAQPSEVVGSNSPIDHCRLLVIDGPDPTTPPGRALRQRLVDPGLVGIVVAPSADRLPASCSVVIEVDDLGDADIARPALGSRTLPVVIAGISHETATRSARALAQYDDPEQAVVSRPLPSQVPLSELLGHLTRDADRLEVPMGIGRDGVVHIDLVADGPHALIGGTTGSGKSELLRSLVVSMAASHTPDEVVFVLVDYKGGSAFDACGGLPHVVGLVTDLDGSLARRALRSLEAELRLREEWLRAAGVEDLRAYRAVGSPSGALPRLVVVVDEFAALAVELPEFLGSLVGVARRGRSLGVHLVLATQRPSGVVNAEIRANTNLRIALRMQDPTDSQDVIDGREAATIARSTPGRAYVRVGPGDVVVVQTAMSGCRVPAVEGGGVVVRPRTRFADADEDELGSFVATGATILGELVDRCADAQRRSGRKPPRRPWIEPLPEIVDANEIWCPAPDVAPSPTGSIAIALADDPERQRRVVLGWAPAMGHLGLFGSMGSGTTMAVLSAAIGAMWSSSPAGLWVHGFDHGGGAMAALRGLPHVGSIVAPDDVERRSRLIAILADELGTRRGGVGDRPRILVVIDQLPALLAELDVEATSSAAFRRVLVDGPALGISMIVSADRAASVPSAVLASVALRLQLRPADPMDAAALGLRPRDLPDFVPGRAVASGSRLELQLPRFDDDAARHVAERWAGVESTCAAVEVLPDLVPFETLPEPMSDDGLLQLAVGRGGPDLDVRTIDLGDGDHVFVAGPAGSGVSTVLRSVIRQLRRAGAAGVIVVIADDRSPVRIDAGTADAVGTFGQLSEVLAFAERDRGRRWTIVVDGADGLGEAPVLERLARLGHCRLVVGGRADRLHGLFGHWTRCVRTGGLGLLLQPRLDLDGELLGVRLPRVIPTSLPPGRGFLVSRGHAVLIQAGAIDVA